MDLELSLRAALAAGVLVVLPIGVYHRFRSQTTGEPLDRRQEGLFILLTLRPIGVVAVVAVAAWIIDPSSMRWSSLPLPPWLRWTGLAVWTIGTALLVWSLRALGKNLTDTVVTRRAHTLVTTGPYRWVRHPFYDAAALCIVASALVTANWFVFLTGGLALVLIAVRTRTEEEQLLARFGDSFRTYMDRTGRFVPKLRH